MNNDVTELDSTLTQGKILTLVLVTEFSKV